MSDKITMAMEAYQKGTHKSIREAANVFGIPKSTLCDRINGKHKSPKGPNTALSSTIEQLLVKTFIYLSQIGFSLTKSEMLAVVNSYLVDSDQTNLFKNGQPTKDWYYSFMKRHEKLLDFKQPNNIAANRAAASNPVTFDYWFASVKNVYDEHDFHTLTPMNQDYNVLLVIRKRYVKLAQKQDDFMSAMTRRCSQFWLVATLLAHFWRLI